MDRGMRCSIQNSKRNAHERPYTVSPGSQHPVDHRNRCQQDSICRRTTTAIHPQWDKTGSPSDIHIIQLHRYPTSLECHRKRTLHNLHGNAKIKLHDKRQQSDNKNWPQTATGNSSRNSQIPKFSSSRQISSLHQWHLRRRPTSYNTVQERLLKPHRRQFVKIKNRGSLQVRRTTPQWWAISSERESQDNHGNYLSQISRTGSFDTKTTRPANKGTGHLQNIGQMAVNQEHRKSSWWPGTCKTKRTTEHRSIHHQPKELKKTKHYCR